MTLSADDRSPSTSTSPHSLGTAVSSEAATMDKSKRYDRGIRVWGAHGQEALEAARVCLLNAGPTGTEALKNLVLGGIHSFTIVDGAKVTPADLGNNFLLTADALAGSRAQCATGAESCGGGAWAGHLMAAAVQDEWCIGAVHATMHGVNVPAADIAARLRHGQCNKFYGADSVNPLCLHSFPNCAAECLKELNESVAGSYVEEAPRSLMNSNPDFFRQFTLVIATQASGSLQAQRLC